jgi:hypothetical protein
MTLEVKSKPNVRRVIGEIVDQVMSPSFTIGSFRDTQPNKLSDSKLSGIKEQSDHGRKE